MLAGREGKGTGVVLVLVVGLEWWCWLAGRVRGGVASDGETAAVVVRGMNNFAVW